MSSLLLVSEVRFDSREVVPLPRFYSHTLTHFFYAFFDSAKFRDKGGRFNDTDLAAAAGP